ncbi:winged helix-turn-helix domain-containing protein [Candidatus Woesearchaeota archaeon]|nr:winged helix-turn-helix domain-containing protein [Candidatus Woesearchaeota archaeon]
MVKEADKSFYTLAQKVLSEQKKPMHYVDLTKEIMKTKESKGKTPERTVIAVIQRDKHNVFVRMGDGVFGLSSFKEVIK